MAWLFMHRVSLLSGSEDGIKDMGGGWDWLWIGGREEREREREREREKERERKREKERECVCGTRRKTSVRLVLLCLRDCRAN